MATTAKQYKKNVKKGIQEIILPTGNAATMKAPGMQAFLAQGFIPNSLLDIVMKALDTNSGKPQKTKAQQEAEERQQAVEFMTSIANDPEKLADLMQTLDRVWLECVIEPATLPVNDPATGEPWAERDDELLYVDEVDFDDKFFVFNVAVGGAKDLEKFREGSAANVDALQERNRPVRPTKRTTGRTRKS